MSVTVKITDPASWREAARKLGYGEIKAPMDVDTLRDDECPVCSATDLWDGNECRNCQYIAPPKPFRDPDLDLAKNLDLRKDIDGDAADLPEQDPSEATQADGEPLMADQVDENGEPIEPGDEDEQLDPETGEPLDPDQISEDGTPEVPTDVDPEAAQKHFNQGGEPFTEGPNAPTDEEPAEPLEEPGQEAEDDDTEQTPDSLAEQNADDAEQVAEEAEESGAMPAVKGPNADGPALMCVNCGFTANAAAPMSVNRDGDSGAGDGMMDGDVCPNCQAALLTTQGEVNRSIEQTPAPFKALQ